VSFFSRVRDFFGGIFGGGDTPSSEPPPPPSPPQDDWSWDTGPSDNPDNTGTGFPSGWKIVGLFTEGDGVTAVDHDDVTNRDVANADAIIVKHVGRNGIVSHRTIHGAPNVKKVATIIVNVTMVGSPPGTGARDK
jgi:hypothetical protein